MNINHVAKKPFLDIFYKWPIMHHFLRAGLYDATSVYKSGPAGPRGILRFDSEVARAGNPQITRAIKLVDTEVKKMGNHITENLSYNDLIQLGAYTAVEYCGGPTMDFKSGRVDAELDEVASSDNVLMIKPDELVANSVHAPRF